MAWEYRGIRSLCATWAALAVTAVNDLIGSHSSRSLLGAKFPPLLEPGTHSHFARDP
jgi:hypothetical protein